MMKFIRNFKKVYKYAYGYRRYIVLYFIMSIIISFLGVIGPIVSARQLVHFTSGFWDKVIFCSLFLFLIDMFDSVISFFNGIVSAKFSKKVISRIQIELGREILKIQLEDIDKHSNGLFIQRLTRDTSEISSIFTFGIIVFSHVIRELGVLIVIFTINIWLGFFFLLFFCVFLFLQRIRIKKIDKKDKELRDQREKTSGFTTELIRGIRDIKMLNAEESFMKNVCDNINSLNEKDYDISYVSRIFGLINSVVRYLFQLLLVILIILCVKNGIFEIAMGIVIFNYRYDVLGLVHSLNGLLDFVRNFNLSCTRVFSLFDGDEFKKETFGSKHLEKVKGNFSFKDVCFGYDTEKLVLNHISFEIKANEMVAFVGKSGVGKSTIFSLLCKLYDADSGEIKIDGVDINELDKDSIRGNITIINQNPYIFNMSIRDNLRIVKDDMTEEEMVRACRLSCLDEFISTLKDGYDTVIGEGGVNLSGGQRQRLAIARAFVQKTEIILFDEATSALDNETQSSIQMAIDNMRKDYTILIIAHRLSTVIDSDRILFIDEGKVVDSGSHSELMKRNKDYRNLYEKERVIQ